MNVSPFRRARPRVLIIVAGILAVAAAFGISPASATAMGAFSPQSPQGRALLASSVSKTIMVDPATGTYTKVVAGVPPTWMRHDAEALNAWVDAQAATHDLVPR